MVFCKPTFWCLMLAVSAAHCQRDGERQEKYRCPTDLAKLERGGMVEVFSPNANTSCTSADITLPDNSTLPRISIVDGNVPCVDFPMQYISLPGNVSTGLAKISWNCGGADIYCRMVHIGDPATTGTAISTAVISQTCIIASHLPSGTGSLTASAVTSMASSSVPADGSMVPTTQGTVVIGSSAMPSLGPTTGLPTELPTDHTTGQPTGLATTQNQGPAPTSTLPGNPEGTEGTTHDGGGSVPSMTHNSEPFGPSTGILDHQTTAALDSVAPANPTATQNNGSASVPEGTGLPTSSTDKAVQTCTCQNN